MVHALTAAVATAAAAVAEAAAAAALQQCDVTLTTLWDVLYSPTTELSLSKMSNFLWW